MIKKISFIFIIIVIYSCATVQNPTGGEKDEKAPILYQSNPKDQSVNFQGKEIKLFFNEWMQLDQLNKQLIITPREDIQYEATLKKQELIIELEETLKDSTTYTFNFREALKDITEGNLWEKPTIAFSTGPFLDSLKISGTIQNIHTNTATEGFLVGLYPNDIDTANLRQGKPIYFTTTDKEGNFLMQNLKGGEYRLYTFLDKNNNLINESPKEPFGFHHQVLSLYDSIESININTYKRNEDTLKLKKYSPVGKDFIIQYNKGLSQYNLRNPSDSNQFIFTNEVEDSKYLKVYKENFPQLEYDTDSVLLFSNVIDSIGNKRTDSVYFRLRESRLTNDTIKITNTPESKIISGPQRFKYKFSKPVAQINYDSLQIRIDSIPLYNLTKDNLQFNYNRKELTIITTLRQDTVQKTIDSLIAINTTDFADTANTASDSSTVTKQPENAQQKPSTAQLNLHFGKAAFLGIENDSTNSVTISFTFKKIEDYGIIKGQVIEPEFPFVLELLNDDYKVIDTIVNQTEYQFNYVAPGKYRLRLIKDANNNQQWDAGNPLTLKKEEEYVYYDELITVKANWEIIDKNFNFSVDNEVDSGAETEDL